MNQSFDNCMQEFYCISAPKIKSRQITEVCIYFWCTNLASGWGSPSECTNTIAISNLSCVLDEDIKPYSTQILLFRLSRGYIKTTCFHINEYLQSVS